jgi:hypothetical protein
MRVCRKLKGKFCIGRNRQGETVAVDEFAETRWWFAGNCKKDLICLVCQVVLSKQEV